MSNTRPEEKQKELIKQPVYTKPKTLVRHSYVSIPKASGGMLKMPDTIINKVASYLNRKESHRFFVTSHYACYLTENNKNCINTTFYEVKLKAMLNIARKALYECQKECFNHSLLVAPFFIGKYNRALHLYNVITMANFRLALFALYVLLDMSITEASRMKKALLSHFGAHILEEIDANVRQLFANDAVLHEMKKQCLSVIKHADRKYSNTFEPLQHLESDAKASLECDAKAPKKGSCSIS